MKKDIFAFIPLFILLCPVALQAQNTETEITFTDSAGHEEVIELTDAMTQDLDSMLLLYNNRLYLHPDTNCNFPDVNPVYDAETYKQRLRSLPTVMELPYNEIVQKFIDRYTNDLRRSVAYMLGAQNFYMPEFEEALESYGLPLELKYLPVIESALNPQATSHAGAAGLWQFMITTAKQYGLTVNSLVDERRDLVKSSYAAAHLLKDLYDVFGDWNLVIAAYNCGTSKVNKAIHRSKGQRDYWAIYPKLPKETRGYVPAFIAANYLMNYYCEHNICPMATSLPTKTDTVMVGQDLHFEQIASVLPITVDELQTLNPQYRRNIVNGYAKPAALRLPVELVTEFIDKQDSIYATSPSGYKPKRTEVSVGDKATYNVRGNQVERVASSSSATNDDEADDGGPVVQKSTRSGKSKRSSSRRTSRTRSSRHSSKTVSVRSGDTLSEIAERNNTSVARLRKLNGIKGSSIRTGQKIRVR